MTRTFVFHYEICMYVFLVAALLCKNERNGTTPNARNLSRKYKRTYFCRGAYSVVFFISSYSNADKRKTHRREFRKDRNAADASFPLIHSHVRFSVQQY